MSIGATNIRTTAVEHARRFRWGFENACGGSDDWRCGAGSSRGWDNNIDPMTLDDGPCSCPECEGATARMWSKDGKMPLSIRVALNLSSPPATGK